MDLKKIKRKARKEVLDRLIQSSPQDSYALGKNIETVIHTHKGLWGGFYPLPTEPQIFFLFQETLSHWAFPKIEGSNLCYYSHIDGFVPGPLGTQEPFGGKKCDPQELKGLLIPGLSFDLTGGRLGRGGGFYDRFLSSFYGVKMGVCFEIQIINEVPRANFDRNVDGLITEKRAMYFRKVF